MFARRFLLSEWQDVVDAWQLTTWEAYRDVRRLGRKTRLPEQQRQKLWEIFSCVRSMMQKHQLITISEMFRHVAKKVQQSNHPPFDHVYAQFQARKVLGLIPRAEQQSTIFVCGPETEAKYQDMTVKQAKEILRRAEKNHNT